MTLPSRPARVLCALLCTLAMAACGANGGTGPAARPPVITVDGVADGGSYAGAVTVTIAVDRGSYEATLNGAPFTSGRTIAEPGAYTLLVIARNGLDTSTVRISFSIAPPPGGTLIVRLFNLGANASGGGGDAILVTDSSAGGLIHVLIDAGPAGSGGSDTDFVRRRLSALGVDTIAYMILTHAHADHYLGMSAILAGLPVRRFLYNGQVRSAVTYERTIADARTHADSVIVVRDTIPVAFGRSSEQSRFTIMPPIPAWLSIDTDDSTPLNDGSVGMQLRRGTFAMFFTGDGEVQANNRWRTQFPAYTRNIDVLKVGHHGANDAIFDNGFSGLASWLDHTSPSISVISANGTSHPRRNALTRLLAQTNMRTYCTSVHGDITLRIYSDSRVIVTVERSADADCVPGTQATT
ncbi:MAG TPA: MBL fold metallo-hydrolase [Longimicrobiales bacterium]|nr:MBL fold metallo-hydrolase [Longimicrobiales bacterium]